MSRFHATAAARVAARGLALLLGAMLAALIVPAVAAGATGDTIATGTVTDAVTTNPLQGVYVSASWWDGAAYQWTGDAVSAPDGKFTLHDDAGMGVGFYEFFAYLDSYEVQTNLNYWWDGINPLTVDFQLVWADIIATGIVGDTQTGDPIEGAHVAASWFDGVANWYWAGDAWTLIDGSYVVYDSYACGPGIYEIHCESYGYDSGAAQHYWNGTNPLSIGFTLMPHAPVAEPDTYTTAYNTALTVPAPGVLANDSDPDGDPITAVPMDDVAHGTLTLNANGSFTYTPDAGFSGTDTFAYEAKDVTQLYSLDAAVTITVTAPGHTFVPIAGANRYATAVEVSKKAFPSGAEAVVIATGENWPDALGGSALAGAMSGPILLTRRDALPFEVLSEITRLGAKKAVILGSTAAVSGSVESALKAELGSANVKRLGGANRYETARLIAAELAWMPKVVGPYLGYAFVATGGNFPDALGASPVAAAQCWSIYLVNPRTGVDSALVAAMKADGVTNAIVLGDAKAVSAASKDAIASGVPCTTERLAGPNRYDTAVQVARYGVAHDMGWNVLGWNKVALATGQNFPDALSGGVMQGLSDSVMLLTPGTSLNPSVASTLTINKAAIHEVRFLGDTKAISAGVRAAVANALK